MNQNDMEKEIPKKLNYKFEHYIAMEGIKLRLNILIFLFILKIIFDIVI